MMNYSFSDIFDIDELQKLMDSLSATLKVGISIRGPHGERFTRDSDYCQFCQNFIKTSEIGKSRCEQSDLALCGYKERSPFIWHCKSAGLIDAGINIMIEDVHVASMLVGQVRLAEDELCDVEYRCIARELNLDEEEYLKQVHAIPVKTKAEFRNILDTLSLIAEQLSVLGYRNLTLKSMISSLENQEMLHQKERNILEQLAEKDPLTGLHNRHKFEQALEQFADYTEPLCLVSADVNYLKLTNDIFGHETGDILLQTIAQTIQGLSKEDWVVSRCGGDEFRLILPGCSLDTAEDFCKRVLMHCQKDRSLSLPLSIAMGTAQWEPDKESLVECFDRADELMYRHKGKVKQEQHLPDYIMERLFDRMILTKEVTDYSAKVIYHFADYLGLPTIQADKLKLAVKYEDIGMIKLPEHFMLRGKSRTPEEKEQVKAHVIHSNMLTRQFEELYSIADIILYTHENWDGNGYPKQLSGCHIPFESRIIRIVNNYCYWTVSTLVGSNLTKEQAKERLIRESGKMYDPALVNKFIKFVNKYNY